MFITPSLIAVLATSLPVIFAAPVLEARQNGVSCQTSGGSPYTEDVTNVINELTGRGEDALCRQTNDVASKCTTLVSHKSAAITICGQTTSDGPTCQDVASYANNIQQTCQDGTGSENRAGGTYTISAGQTIEVIHS